MEFVNFQREYFEFLEFIRFLVVSQHKLINGTEQIICRMASFSYIFARSQKISQSILSLNLVMISQEFIHLIFLVLKRCNLSFPVIKVKIAFFLCKNRGNSKMWNANSFIHIDTDKLDRCSVFSSFACLCLWTSSLQTLHRSKTNWTEIIQMKFVTLLKKIMRI